MKIKIGVAVAALWAVVAIGTVARAASMSEAYVANVRPQVAFLDQASQLAAKRASSDKLRAFAKAEAEADHQVFESLKGWAPPGLTVANNLDDATPKAPDAVLTGRSVATDATIGWAPPEDGVVTNSPGAIVMPHLAMLQGPAFDALYKTMLAASLKNLAGFYESYRINGDDPALRSMAMRELPLIKDRLAELGRL